MAFLKHKEFIRMKLTKQEKKEETQRLEFTVESDAQEFEGAIQKAYLKNKKQIAIPGFRKGKAPLAIIEGYYGPEIFYQDALDELAQSAFEAGIEEGNIKMIGMPAIVAADVNAARCAVYTFSVELYPEVELGEYKGLEVTKVPVEVSDEEVEAEIAAEQKKNARILTVEDRPAQMGDTANIDFIGYLDKEKTEKFDGGSGENYDLELGSNSFVPGFEDQLVGMSVGEEKDIAITFPENYVEDLAGKDVVFWVKINSLSYPQLPELDDEFAKDVSEFDTLAEYKEDVKKGILSRKEEQAKATQRNEAILKACDNMKAEVPETMIRSHIDAIIRNFASNYGVSDPNIDTQTLASMLGIDENTMNTAIRPSAVMETKTELLVNAIIEKEGIEGTDEQIEEYLNKISGTVNASPDDIKKYFGMDYIVNEYKKEAAMNLVSDSAVLVDAPAEKPAKKPAAKKTTKKAAKPEAESAEAEEKPAEEKKPAPKKKAAPKKAKAETQSEEKAEEK